MNELEFNGFKIKEKENIEKRKKYLNWHNERRDTFYEIMTKIHNMNKNLFPENCCLCDLLKNFDISSYYTDNPKFIKSKVYSINFEDIQYYYENDIDNVINLLGFLFVSGILLIDADEYCDKKKLKKNGTYAMKDALKKMEVDSNDLKWERYVSYLIEEEIYNIFEKLVQPNCENLSFYIDEERLIEILEKDLFRILIKHNVDLEQLNVNNVYFENKLNKNLKVQFELEDKFNDMKNNLNNFNRDIMVIMTLFIAAIGFVTTNTSVYKMIEKYSLGRQLFTILVSNFSLVYIIFTIFVCIDHVVSFNNKSSIKNSWFNMTLIMAIFAILAFLLGTIGIEFSMDL